MTTDASAERPTAPPRHPPRWEASDLPPPAYLRLFDAVMKLREERAKR